MIVSFYQGIGWYWYGCGRNTYAENLFFETADDAKSDAMKAYLAAPGAKEGGG